MPISIMSAIPSSHSNPSSIMSEEKPSIPSSHSNPASIMSEETPKTGSPNPFDTPSLETTRTTAPNPFDTPSLNVEKIEFGMTPSPSDGSLTTSESGGQQRLRFSRSATEASFNPKSRTSSRQDLTNPHFSQSTTSLFNIRQRRLASPYGNNAAFRQPYPSTRLKSEIEKPWLTEKDSGKRWSKIIFWGLFGLGWALVALICFMAYRGIQTVGNLCLVMDDDFSQESLRSDYWSHEVRLDGYGNGQFEWTTASPNNTIIRDNTLYLVPTLTSDAIGGEAIVNGYTVNLTTAGTCTSNNVTQCVAVSNSSTGTIINPVQGARIVTRNKVSIKYGKVEVTARMPVGDWIWPAIWMMPQDSVYGQWPRSGEIDIVESRGNGRNYGVQGNNHVQSTLHWGPVAPLDSYWKTMGIAADKVNGFTDGYRKYTLEWNDKFIMMYTDTKVKTIMNLPFDKPFWDRGNFPSFWVNKTETQRLVNPWFNTEGNAAPFDQSFYLIMNVAVGGTNGYFPDGLGSKPWQDSSATAMLDFWSQREKWLPTWPTDPTKRGMGIKRVKMWQKC